MDNPLGLSVQDWTNRLTDLEYAVLREGATEAPFVGIYTDCDDDGVYRCKACGVILFRSSEKFHSGCGWPSFFAPADNAHLLYLSDTTIPGRPRTEVRCATCGSHLGHVFDGEGFDTPTDVRYCINSVCLDFEKDNETH